MVRNLLLRFVFSLGAVSIIIMHQAWPTKFDVTTVGLIILVILLWFAPRIETVEVPGVLRVTFEKIKEAGDKIITQTLPGGIKEQTPIASSSDVLNKDPNMAIIRLGIRIEDILRTIAKKHQIDDQLPLAELLQCLKNSGVFNDDGVSALQELIDARNKAAHGAKVEKSIKDWAFEYGPSILAALDAKLER